MWKRRKESQSWLLNSKSERERESMLHTARWGWNCTRYNQVSSGLARRTLMSGFGLFRVVFVEDVSPRTQCMWKLQLIYVRYINMYMYRRSERNEVGRQRRDIEAERDRDGHSGNSKWENACTEGMRYNESNLRKRGLESGKAEDSRS